MAFCFGDKNLYLFCLLLTTSLVICAIDFRSPAWDYPLILYSVQMESVSAYLRCDFSDWKRWEFIVLGVLEVNMELSYDVLAKDLVIIDSSFLDGKKSLSISIDGYAPTFILFLLPSPFWYNSSYCFLSSSLASFLVSFFVWTKASHSATCC